MSRPDANIRPTQERSESREDVFERAFHAFEPDHDDSPSAIPYYRAFAGLQAAWGTEFCERYNHALHQAGCAAGALQSGRYNAAVVTLRHMVDKAKLPSEPYHRTNWEMCPAEPAESDVVEFFRVQFRAAFPGKRVNSRFAKEQWEAKRARAAQIVRERYEQALAAWRVRDNEIRAQNEKARQEWLTKVHGMAAFENAARKILNGGQ